MRTTVERIALSRLIKWEGGFKGGLRRNNSNRRIVSSEKLQNQSKIHKTYRRQQNGFIENDINNCFRLHKKHNTKI